MTQQPSILISEEDASRLFEVLETGADSHDPDAVDLLDTELGRAQVVARAGLPPDVVTMNSRVVFEDRSSGRRREIVLVYPEKADAASGRISVLSRVGSGLLGLAVGQEISWPMPRGEMRTLRVISVEQPSASSSG